MAKKISELPAAISVVAADLVPIVQGGVTKQATASLFAATSVPPPVITVTATSRTIAVGDAGSYLRFTATGAKTATFDLAQGYSVDEEYHLANRATSGNLTIVAASSAMGLNPPRDGTLVLEPGHTVTVKMSGGTSSGADEADVFGSTS